MRFTTKKLLFEGFQLRITTNGRMFLGAPIPQFSIYDLLKSNFEEDELWDISDDSEDEE